MTPDVINASTQLSSAALRSAIYAGDMRARKRLILPELLRQLIEDVSARTAS